ncbi:MAG: hypothetical protein ABIM57_00255, partial [candidate division WOR-3 bacterium]
IPNFLIAKSGVHSLSVKNLIIDTSLKKEIVSKISINMIPKVVITERKANKKNILFINFSSNFFLLKFIFYFYTLTVKKSLNFC